MAKFKSLNDLTSLYIDNVRKEHKPSEYNEVLLTDATNYLPKTSTPKVGEAFGEKKQEVAKDTGPEAAEGVEEVKEPSVKDEGEKSKGNAFNAGKQTTPKEKTEKKVETNLKETKYIKPQFTMAKSKFDRLYEDAIKGAPFVKENENLDPVPPTDEVPVDADVPTDDNLEPEVEEMSMEEVVDCLRKVLTTLEKQVGGGAVMGDEGEDVVDVDGGEDLDTPPVAEAVDAEDRGHAIHGSGVKTEMGKDGHKIQKVGNLKTAGAASEQGGPKGADGKVEKAKDFDKSLQSVKGSPEPSGHTLKPNKGSGNMFEK